MGFSACLHVMCWKRQLLASVSLALIWGTCQSLVGSNTPPPVPPDMWPGTTGSISQCPNFFLQSHFKNSYQREWSYLKKKKKIQRFCLVYRSQKRYPEFRQISHLISQYRKFPWHWLSFPVEWLRRKGSSYQWDRHRAPPFPWAELWSSQPLTGFNVWGPGPLREKRASGWKLFCEGRTPTASPGSPSSPLERSHPLARSQKSCQPQFRTLLGASAAQQHGLCGTCQPSMAGLCVTDGNPPVPERRRLSEHEEGCMTVWTRLRE